MDSSKLSYHGSTLLTISSIVCFGLPLVIAAGNRYQRIGILAQCIASIMYHSTGKSTYLLIDTSLRNVLGPLFVTYEIYRNNNWEPLLWGLIALTSYIQTQFAKIIKILRDRNLNLMHCLLVHIPVMIGFFTLRG